MRYLFAAVVAAVTALSPALAQAPFPNRAIKILVPISPGGAPDVAARLVGQFLSEQIGQPVVVENRTGANGNIAADAVVKSSPDGYTLLLGADSGIVINPHVYSNLPFDPLKDLIPVATVAANQFILAVNPQLPVKTLPEFIEYARKADPPLPYASGGNGSQHQLAMEMLKQRAGINLLHVPFRGAAPASTATIAGDTKALFTGTAGASQIRSGLMRAIAMSGKTRSTRFPAVPTINEFYPGYEVQIWLGLFAPAGTPEPVVAKLREEARKMLANPSFVEKLTAAGSLEPLDLSPAEFSALIRRDYDKYGALVKSIGVKFD